MYNVFMSLIITTSIVIACHIPSIQQKGVDKACEKVIGSEHLFMLKRLVSS